MRYLFRVGSGRGSSQEGMREREFMLDRTGRCHGDADTANADPHQGADLEQLQADCATGGGGELGVRKPDPAQRTDQHIGEGGKP